MSAEVTAAAPPRARRSLPDLVAREEHLRWRRRVIFWLSAVAVVVAGLGLWRAFRPRPTPMAARFRTQTVTRGEVVRTVRATGHVEAVTTVIVGAEVSGRIATVDVDFNDRVKAGQVLARFDRASLSAQTMQAGAVLASVRSAAEQARIDREQARRNLARADGLHASKSISDADFENATSAARLAERRAEAAESQVAAQEAAFSVTRTNLDHSVIVSPINGVIITRNVDPGQTVASMLATPVLFTVAADLAKMRVVAAVDEADIGEVHEGQRATFTVNAYPDRVFEGRVTEVRNAATVVQDVVTYGAVVEVENADLALKPSMTASVRVITASAPDTLRVPASAVRFTPPQETPAETPGVWTLTDGALRRIPLKTGVTNGEVTAVDGAGVDVGTPLVVELTPKGRVAYGLVH